MTAPAIFPSLQGRVVVITGGATGIGACLVRGFVRNGARVAFLDIERDAGTALATETGATFLPCDLTDIPTLRAAIAEVEQQLGPVHTLVNNAANDRRNRIEDVTPEDWDASHAVNLRHQVFAAQAVIAGMKAAGGGVIVNLSTVAWMFGATDMLAYSTVKSAVIGLTRSLANALGPHNIRVNAVAPGAVMTEKQMRLWHTPESKARLVAQQSIPQDVGEQDIAAAVLFLCSDDARMITKQCLIVDGGLS